jgi:hypothetical protein
MALTLYWVYQFSVPASDLSQTTAVGVTLDGSSIAGMSFSATVASTVQVASVGNQFGTVLPAGTNKATINVAVPVGQTTFNGTITAESALSVNAVLRQIGVNKTTVATLTAGSTSQTFTYTADSTARGLTEDEVLAIFAASAAAEAV